MPPTVRRKGRRTQVALLIECANALARPAAINLQMLAALREFIRAQDCLNTTRDRALFIHASADTLARAAIAEADA